jgi:outer membrane receptor protein involved in Fe transport
MLILLLTASFAGAVNYGKISGQVTDADTGEPLPGTNVVVEGTDLGAATNLDGTYNILQVPPGTYTVRATMMGYQTVRVQRVTVRSNRITVADVDMQQKVIQASDVVVVAERPVVEKDVTATLRSVDREVIQTIPSTTVDDVVRLQPGMISSGGLHLRGGRSNEVTYYMDGIPLVNPLFSEINSSQVINRDAISELQVISGTYSAEYGNSMSGIINISTRDGGKQLSGTVDVKSSAIAPEDPSQDNNRTVVRTNIGGPLLSPKTSFFLSGSWDDRDNYLPWGYRNEKSLYAKITDRHIKNLRISLGVNLSDGEQKSYSHAWRYIPDQYWRVPRTHSNLVQLTLTHTLKRNLYYNLNIYRTSYHYDSGDYDIDDLTSAYQLDENNEFFRQATVTSYAQDDQSTLGIKADLLWQANGHNEVKTGFEFRQHQIDNYYIASPFYDDHTLDDYTAKPREFALYLQDKINFSSIILSAGLRFDLVSPNASYWENPYDAYNNQSSGLKDSEPHTQWSPRLGISYPVSDQTVFHFGYGHYFQRPEYQFMYKGLSDAGYRENVVMNLRTGNGRFGDPNLKPQKTITYEFGVGHQLLEDYLLNLSVYSKKITDLTGTRTFFAGSRADIWETYTIHINEDFAYNNGLEVQLKKIHGTYFIGEVNYTYSVAEGSSSGPLERVGIEEANRQTLKFFPLDFDQRHTLNAFLSVSIPQNHDSGLAGWAPLQGLRSTLLFQYGSGLPYTKGTRGATEPYEINNQRLPENWTLDLKLHRDIDIGSVLFRPYLEIYNLTDRKNVVDVDPFTGEPDEIEGRTREWAADPENWGPPRLIYLGIEMRY